MAQSRQPGVTGHHAAARAAPPRTPGPLGRFDAAQPDFFTFQGDTSGPLGTNGDWAASGAVCRAPSSYSWLATTSVAATSVAPTAASDAKTGGDTEVWVFSRKAFILALSTVAAYASPAKDTLTWAKLWADFGLKGRYYIKVVNGTEYIIFKGYAGLRETITGTRYLAENPKVLSMAIGRSGAIRSGVDGGVLSLVLVGAADIIEFLLRDDETLSELGVKLFSDMTKTMISAAIGTAVAVTAAALGAPVVVPLALSIAVGVVASKGLDYLDDKYHLTKTLQAWVDRKTGEIAQILDDARRRLNEAGRRAADAIELLIRMKHAYDEIERGLEDLRRLLSSPIPSL